MKQYTIKDIKCEVFPSAGSDKVIYIVYPEIVPISQQLIQTVVASKKDNIVVVLVPADEWNNYLTPWPEPGETPSSQPFAGRGAYFLDLLRNDIIPMVEDTLNLPMVFSRYLLGVSLSGLFALWQWMQCDLFHSIACLSGSFWYDGFIEWFDARPVPQGKGPVFFLLGTDEPKAKIKAYRTIGVNTEEIVKKLGDAGLSVTFKWVPGNHFADPSGRLQLGLDFLTGI